jgi:hypothetical protein
VDPRDDILTLVETGGCERVGVLGVECDIHDHDVVRMAFGMEMSFIPSGEADEEEQRPTRKKKDIRKGVEVFGAGMERGVEEQKGDMSENERSGRKQRRKGMRSGSKNVFRQIRS